MRVAWRGPSDDAWLRPGAGYDVLEVRAEPERRVQLRIAGEQSGSPVLFDSARFDSVDGTIPSHWRARLTADGTLTLGPEEWSAPGFWEAYFEHEPAALAAYERARVRS